MKISMLSFPSPPLASHAPHEGSRIFTSTAFDIEHRPELHAFAIRRKGAEQWHHVDQTGAAWTYDSRGVKATVEVKPEESHGGDQPGAAGVAAPGKKPRR